MKQTNRTYRYKPPYLQFFRIRLRNRYKFPRNKDYEIEKIFQILPNNSIFVKPPYLKNNFIQKTLFDNCLLVVYILGRLRSFSNTPPLLRAGRRRRYKKDIKHLMSIVQTLRTNNLFPGFSN